MAGANSRSADGPRPKTPSVCGWRARRWADFVLIVDANQGYSLRDAVEFSRLVADLNIRWFEEPVRWENDRLDMAAARNHTGIPICAGQSEISRAGCRDLMMSGAIDVCNFDASWGGGPTEWRRVAALAASLRRRDGASRGAADFRPPARPHFERHLSRDPSTRIAIRCSICLSPIGRRSSTATIRSRKGRVRPGARSRRHRQIPGLTRNVVTAITMRDRRSGRAGGRHGSAQAQEWRQG